MRLDLAVLGDQRLDPVATMFSPDENPAAGAEAVHRRLEAVFERGPVERRIAEDALVPAVDARAPLVDPEPHQDKRQDDQVAGADHERLEHEGFGGRGNRQSREQIEQGEEDRRERGGPPSPANGGGEEDEHEGGEEGTGVALGREDQEGEHGDVDRMGDAGEPSVEPPVVPGARQHRQREGDIGTEHRPGQGRRLRGLADVHPDGEQEQARQHVAADRDHAPGWKSQPPHHRY